MKKLLLRIQFPDRDHVAEDLAVSRIATFAYLIFAHWNFLQFERLLTLPIEMSTPSGLSLNGIFEIAAKIPAWKLGYQIALVCGLFGFLTPLAIAIVSLMFSVGVSLSFSYGFSSHDPLPLSVLLWMLVLADTSRKYSIDSVLFKRYRSSSKSAKLINTRMLVSSAAIRGYLTLIAFASGYTKLKTSGLTWALSDNLQNILIRQNYYFESLIQNSLQRDLNLLVTSIPYLHGDGIFCVVD